MNAVELLAVKHPHDKGMAICLKPKVSFVMTKTLVAEIRTIQKKVVEKYYAKPWSGVYYLIWYLYSGSIPCKGMDLGYIYKSLLKHHEKKVEDYIGDIFELLFLNYVGLGLPLLTCSIANRETSGISKEFFLLNRINFIKNGALKDKNQVKKLDLSLEKIKVHFSPEIYERNHFYEVGIVNLASMRKILSGFSFDPIPEDELRAIKLYFDEARDKTLQRIYNLASRNVQVLRRMSEIQSFEHREWLFNNRFNSP